MQAAATARPATFSEGVAVDDFGEWTRFYERRAFGTGSPIEQNRKHIAVTG